MTPAFATLSEWLFYLENRPQQPIQLGIERIRTVAERLQLLPVQVPVITVAGTNGKGSTVAALEAIYTAMGYQVGAYTSPHLFAFNERIRVNQIPAADDSICQAFRVIDEARQAIHLTYFEMATLAALLHFKTCHVEVIILEVGLGGRLDATNIVDAAVGIITTIDFDHMDLLGDTLEAIGYEKAGIIKPSQKALIYADREMPNSIQQRADQLQVSTLTLGDAFDYTLDNQTLDIDLMLSCAHIHHRLTMPCPLIHPAAAVAAVVAVDVMSQILPVELDVMRNALAHVTVAGRIQVIYDTIRNIFDVSHNRQSVRLLANRVEMMMKDKPNGRVYAVFSALKDKALTDLIEPMSTWVDEWHTAVLDNHRAASLSVIQAAFQDVCGLSPTEHRTIVDAFKAARKKALPGDTVIVYGSFYVVSPVMEAFNAAV